MTSDIKMLPLPSVLLNWPHPTNHVAIRDYARAVAEHNVKERDAEIEALRAEVEAWRELSDHVRAGACNAIWPDRYTDARTRDVAAALKRAERLAEALREIERLMPDQAGPAWIAKTIASAPLRDHDKEGLVADPTTALREVLALSNKERDAEENREYGAANDLYADLQGAAVNLVRDHGPALLSALEDARRYRWLRGVRPGQAEIFMENDGIDLDAAIDAAREARNG